MDASILALVLAAAPTPSTPADYAPLDVSDIEVEASDGVVTQHIDVTFADGLYLFASACVRAAFDDEEDGDECDCGSESDEGES